MGLLGKVWANCFKTPNVFTMYPLGKCPLAPSVSEKCQNLLCFESLLESLQESAEDSSLDMQSTYTQACGIMP